MNFLILTGGENKRIGNRKAFLKIGGTTLLERVLQQIEIVKEKGEEVILVEGKVSFKNFKNIKGEGEKLKVIKDVIPEKGPLGGIYSGLLLSQAKFNFVLGCDMPFLDWKFIDYMRHLSKNYEVLIPFHSRGIEPLHAIYSRSCLPVIKEKLNQGECKIQSILPYLKVRFIQEREIRRFSPPQHIFFNINTSEDLKKARKLATKVDKPKIII